MKGLCGLKIAVLALLFISFSSAQAYVKCGRWLVEAETFYAQTENNFFNTFPFAQVFPTTLGESRQTFDIKDRDWDWGYRLGLGYDFPSCNLANFGLTLEYTRYDTDQNSSTPTFLARPGDASPILISPIGSFFWGEFTEARAHLDTNYTTLDLLAHENLVFCNCLHLQLFAGVRYLRLDQDIHASYDFTNASVETPVIGHDLRIHTDSDYKGIGPRIGIGADYPFFRCINIVGEIGGEWLFGTRNTEINDTFIQTDPFTDQEILDNHVRRDRDNHHSVPGISGKLALAFRNKFCNCGWMNVELGYRADRYFDVVDCFKYTNDHDIRGCRCKERNDDNDFTFHGPYLALSFHL